MPTGKDDFNFAIVPQRLHRLPLEGVKFKVLQPLDPNQTGAHGPRVTVFRGNPDTGANFSISLTEDPKLVAGENFLNADEFLWTLEHIIKYRAAYLSIWHDQGADLDNLRAAMEQIALLDQQK